MMNLTSCEAELPDNISTETLSNVQSCVASRYNVVIPLTGERCLVFNSQTGQSVLLSADEYRLFDELVSHKRAHPDKIHEYKLFRAAGFIVASETDELHRVSERFDVVRGAANSLSITIAATLQCNLACGYCFQGLNKPAGKLTTESREAMIALVRRRADSLDRLNIVWYGGEPLMNQAEIWQTASDMLSICDESNIEYSSFIITNGYLLTAEVATKLRQHGVSGAQVTIDGLSNDHNKNRPHVSGRGSFDRIMSNLREVLDETDLAITVRLSVDRGNVEELCNLLEYLAEQGFSKYDQFSVYFAPIEAISEKCGEYEEQTLPKLEYARNEVKLMQLAEGLDLLKIPEFGQNRSICQAIRPNDFVLTPSGDVHKCWDTVTIDGMAVSSILDAGFEEAVANNAWTEWKPQNPVCDSCKIAPICGGGCAFKTVHSDQQSGDSAALPCIPLKFNLAEQVFLRAKLAGVVDESDWDDALSPTIVDGKFKTGAVHTMESKECFL